MHKVISESKTFSKILVAVDELKTSTASTNRAIDYAVNMAQDYDAQLIILYVIRADPRVHGINPPSHVIEMKKEAESRIYNRYYKNYCVHIGRSLFCDIAISCREIKSFCLIYEL